MNASALPGQTLLPVSRDTEFTLWQKIVENLRNWAGAGHHAGPNDDQYTLMQKAAYNSAQA